MPVEVIPHNVIEGLLRLQELILVLDCGGGDHVVIWTQPPRWESLCVGYYAVGHGVPRVFALVDVEEDVVVGGMETTWAVTVVVGADVSAPIQGPTFVQRVLGDDAALYVLPRIFPADG